ncbi:acyl-CoA thioesterase [Nesterenkonia xinjiangensis]|uniref:Acyl-CoA thioesterase 2 n=1 Tax=Nesterenkonia xinjiangensis TaxID=225327 RepID=A0A7Z0GR53_9MICC|nr:acyl-CoA thioesterase II [Nesterenkonia xinjiangensis]NYJ79603.1 acyl-CoA thioesterase-2 [Nesterenkonia xinjiangensis]
MPERPYRIPTPAEAVERLVGMLDLEQLDPAEAAGSEERFRGPVFDQAFWRVFGGQVLAQSAIAAVRTVDSARVIHSVHGYFLRPGDATKPLEIGVERLRDGGSFSARRSQAYQDGRPILSMIASFQRPSPGPTHQQEMPLDIPAPEELAPPHELVGHVKHPVMQEWGHGRPFEIRHVDRPIYLEGDTVPRASNAVWMRARAPLPEDPNIHRAAILYASDYTLLEPVLRRHGLYWAKPGMKVASLDHAMWWHRDAAADEWLLYVQHSPSAQSSRGLGAGAIYNRDGALVATVAQEGMVRRPQGLRPRIQERIQHSMVRSSRTQRQLDRKYGSAWASRYFTR